jgi:hypothetical protein
VVDVTSANSFGLIGPTLISAFSEPSVACQRPSSSAQRRAPFAGVACGQRDLPSRAGG